MDILRPHPDTAAELTSLLPYYRALPLHADLNNLNVSSVSMLHADVLVLMYHLARYMKGPVLELGAYIGGGTTALAMGLRDSERSSTVVSVELGGSFDHPTCGSADIARDLTANLARRGVSRYVNTVIGHSRSLDTIQRVRGLVGTAKVGLLCIDSDGEVQADFDTYGDLLAQDAFLIVDDYFSPGAPHKAIPTKRCLASLEINGIVRPLGLYGWGTWIGRLNH